MITAQIESLRYCWPELLEIFPTHHAELALFKNRMPLCPQTEEYFRREQEGRLFLGTMRWNGKIAAYQITNVAPGFHYGSTLTATQDLVYIHPEVRHKGLAFPLFRLVKRELERRGAKIWHVGYKSATPLGMDKLLPMLGFTPGDTYLTQWVGDDSQSGISGI